MTEIKSEHTKDLSTEELKALQDKVAKMTPEELKTFRNSHNPDLMGFSGQEAI